nr:hypothetical protein [Tanacetum cinerariifolium]
MVIIVKRCTTEGLHEFGFFFMGYRCVIIAITLLVSELLLPSSAKEMVFLKDGLDFWFLAQSILSSDFSEESMEKSWGKESANETGENHQADGFIFGVSGFEHITYFEEFANVFVHIGFNSTIELVSFDESQVVTLNGEFVCGIRDGDWGTGSWSDNTVGSPHWFIIHWILVFKDIKKSTEIVDVKNWNVNNSWLCSWAEGTKKGRKQKRNKSKSWKIGEIKIRRLTWLDALVCCVKNMVADHIMDSGASFHATYCKEELERFKLRYGKVRLVDDKTLYIASIGGGAAVYHQRLGDMIRWFGKAKVSFLHNVSEDKETTKFGVAERLSRTFRAESTGIRVKSPKGGMAREGYKSYTLEDEEYSEDEASSKEGGSETLHVRRSTKESKALEPSYVGALNDTSTQHKSKGFQLAGQEENLECRLKEILYGLIQALRLWYLKFNSFMQKDKNLKVCSWEKLVRILISEGSLSLLKILETKSLAAMFTRLVMKEKLKFCVASTGLRVN